VDAFRDPKEIENADRKTGSRATYYVKQAELRINLFRRKSQQKSEYVFYRQKQRVESEKKRWKKRVFPVSFKKFEKQIKPYKRDHKGGYVHKNECIKIHSICVYLFFILYTFLR